MDWKTLTSVSPHNLDDDRKGEVALELAAIPVDQKLDSKSVKKLFRLAMVVLRYRNDQVGQLQNAKEEDPHLPSTGLLIELQQTVAKLEADRNGLRQKVRELRDENARVQQASKATVEQQHPPTVSDGEDSPDALSEIEKQQELYSKISTKNKQIKRLLRDIEDLEKRNNFQVDTINRLQLNLNDATLSMSALTNQHEEANAQCKEQENLIDELNGQLRKLEDELAGEINERGLVESELDAARKELQDCTGQWQAELEKSRTVLDDLKARYDELLGQFPGVDIEAERKAFKVAVQQGQEKDEIIANLEEKVLLLSKEILISTEVMNRVSEEKTRASREATKVSQCCEENRILLEKANERCQEMLEALTSVEEDNRLKCQQAAEAVDTLRKFQDGEDGLASALRKIGRLTDKVNVRDKQIRQLIAEINLANEIALENSVLRKRLGIGDDEVVATNSVIAKQKRIIKVNERLSLKLRASEEMRLQLSLEKNCLKRRISSLSRKINGTPGGSQEDDLEATEDRRDGESLTTPTVDTEEPDATKSCEKCLKQYNVADATKHCKACMYRKCFNYCDACITKLKVNFTDSPTRLRKEEDGGSRVEELEKSYATVVEENDNLRAGMHEILLKLREYDATSNRLTIDAVTLERLLRALDSRSGWYQQQLGSERVSSPKDRPISSGRNSKSKQSVYSTESIDDSGNVCNDEETSSIMEPLRGESTDFGEQVLLKSLEVERLYEQVETLRADNERLLQTHDDLLITQRLYNELVRFTQSSDNGKDALLGDTVARLKAIELNICCFQRKVDFLQAENDNLQNSLRAIKQNHINLLHELRVELVQKASAAKRLEHELAAGDGTRSVEPEAIEKLEQELARMKLETTGFYTIFLKNIQEVDRENLLALDYASLERFGVVGENLAVDFITKQEYGRLRGQLERAESQLKREIIRSGHLEELLKVSQEQILSQQSIISKCSEDEIGLRHLVADLQSTSNEKYLLTRTQRALETVREQAEECKKENGKLKETLQEQVQELNRLKQQLTEQEVAFDERQKDNTLKIQFLKRTVHMMQESYNACAPTYTVVSFVKLYAQLLELRRSLTQERSQSLNRSRDEEYERLFSKLKTKLEGNHIEDRINLIKFESQCEYLTRQLILSQEQADELRVENDALRLKEVETTRHWDTMVLLFGDGNGRRQRDQDRFFDKEVQVSVDTSVKCINTIPIIDDSLAEKPRMAVDSVSTSCDGQQKRETGQMTEACMEPIVATGAQRSLESQLKQAMMLASTRSALLLEAESRLSEFQGRIKLMEKSLEDKEALLQKCNVGADSATKSDRLEDSILSSTIGSLQNLLLEKDTTLSRYQDLLKNERQEHSRAYDEKIAEIKSLKKTIDELEQQLYERQKDVDNVMTQLQDVNRSRKLESESSPGKMATSGQDASVGQAEERLVYTDNVIENIFEIDEKKEQEIGELKVQIKVLESKLQDAGEERKKLHQQWREATLQERKLEKLLREKESEVAVLNERLCHETEHLREFTETIASAQEIEQLKEMLEEKDRHIQDLTETLSQFHDDQQNYMNDSTLHTAEQVSQLSADLNRSEATNRVLKTQLDALKRQVYSIQQREKQSRELVKTLKNQLIKRPVIAMKPERMSTAREDQLVRKVQQLEGELLDSKDELRKQISINENRRAKNAAELDLWNKQKRWQQTAEKLRVQLKERETELEKLKVHYQSAKTTVARLEKEKVLLEGRGARINSGSTSITARCGQGNGDNKYTPAETPDSCVTDSGSSEETTTLSQPFAPCSSKEIVEVLKNRIESQQRRIIAMELERKGSNSVTHELEKLQEKVSSLETQNVRLEARALQLQLDNDMLRQRDESDRLRGQVNHLEAYIISLKEELTKATAGCPETINFENLCQRCGKLEQTVLTLKRLLERLKAENKTLKEQARGGMSVRNGCPRSKESNGGSREDDVHERLVKDHEKLQVAHTDALNRIATLLVELELHSGVKAGQNAAIHEADDAGDDATTLKDKLTKKSQLLEKAKILLQRAAAKERYLKEQIDLLRRKCSDLQNVPVIDEISE